MRIRMKKTVDGSIDGVTVRTFHAGKEYDIEGPLLDVFIAEKLAEKAPVSEKPSTKRKAAPEKKAVRKAPENK